MLDIFLNNLPVLVLSGVGLIGWKVRQFFVDAEESRVEELSTALDEMGADLDAGHGLMAHQHHFIEVPYWAQFLARRLGLRGRTETHASVRQTTL